MALSRRQSKGSLTAGDEILVGQDEGIVTVALNKPAKRNAVSFAMWQRLGELFTGFARDGDARW